MGFDAGIISGALSVFSIVSSLAGGQAAISQTNALARAEQQRAAETRKRDIRLAQRDSDALLGQQKSAFTFSNVLTGSGSPLQIERETLREARLQIRDIAAGAAFESTRIELRRRFSVGQARQKQFGGVIGGLTTLATRFA